MKKRKAENTIQKKGVVIFVEGETEVEFYKHLIKYLQVKNPGKELVHKISIINLKGVCNYTFKAVSKFKNDIQQKNKDTTFTIICTYDHDVFKYAAKPPVDWRLIKKQLLEHGATDVIQIVAKDKIEDWFLIDLEGLCDYLGIAEVPELKGKDGLEKISNLFKKKNKIYIKGSYCYKFMDKLDMDKIYNRLKIDFEKLETVIFK